MGVPGVAAPAMTGFGGVGRHPHQPRCGGHHDAIPGGIVCGINSIDVGDRLEVMGWAFIGENYLERDRTYIVLKAENVVYLVGTLGETRDDVAELFENEGVERSGFRASVAVRALRPGVYNVGVFMKRSGDSYIRMTSNNVTLNN